MKHFITLFAFVCCSLSAIGSIHNTPPVFLEKIVVINDTVFVNGQPYCLFKKQGNMYTLSSLSIDLVMYVRPYPRNGKVYYSIMIPPIHATYFAEKDSSFFTDLLQSASQYGIIEDGYFSSYGTHLLVTDKLESKKWMEIKDLPELVDEEEIFNKHISWKGTENRDSTIIMADDVPVAYYYRVNWLDLGVNRFEKMSATKATYIYYIKRIGDDAPLAEVQVQDWWQTIVTVITPDGWKHKFTNVSKTEDLMRISCKMALLRDALNK